MTWVQTAVDCQRDARVYEFLSVQGFGVSDRHDSLPECRHRFINLVISYIGCCESSQSCDFSCVRIHRCGGEIIGNYVLLLDTAILRAKLELILINNRSAITSGGLNNSRSDETLKPDLSGRRKTVSVTVSEMSHEPPEFPLSPQRKLANSIPSGHL